MAEFVCSIFTFELPLSGYHLCVLFCFMIEDILIKGGVSVYMMILSPTCTRRVTPPGLPLPGYLACFPHVIYCFLSFTFHFYKCYFRYDFSFYVNKMLELFLKELLYVVILTT